MRLTPTVLEHIEESAEECGECKLLREWLQKEIEEKEYLQSVLFTNARLIRLDVEETPKQEYQPVNRHIPFRVRKAQKEYEQRQKAKGEPAKPADLSEGEKLFESSLKG